MKNKYTEKEEVSLAQCLVRTKSYTDKCMIRMKQMAYN